MDNKSDKELDITNIEDSNIFYDLYDIKNNKITNILNKYEKTKIICERCQMLANGSEPFIDNPESYNNIIDIAIEELNQKKIPFIIKRNINNEEYLKLKDFIIL